MPVEIEEYRTGDGQIIPVMNETGMSTADVLDQNWLQVSSVMRRWTQDVGSSTPTGRRRGGGLASRDRYVTPRKVADQMRTARDAAENDDIVSSVLESTESLAFSKMKFVVADVEQEDVWNQWAAKVDLDFYMRACWRETYVMSQFISAMWWEPVNYKLRGRSVIGTKRKRMVRLEMPTSLSILDSLKIVPVGNSLFDAEQLAYVATKSEASDIDEVLAGGLVDPTISNLMVARYLATPEEKTEFSALGFPGEYFLMDPNAVFRHTETRSNYQQFATVRLKSVFKLLDMKNQLMESDRVTLLANTNFIILIRKGDKDDPADSAEIQNLRAEAQTMAQIPVIISDHRLSIDIITPDSDRTLLAERYDMIDQRISGRLYQNLVASGGGTGRLDDSLKLARVIARGLESRRHMLRRSLERNVIKPIMERNPATLTEMPKLRFYPNRIALDFDKDQANYMLKLREHNEISRDTLLSQVDIDQADEAMQREREEHTYDKIFKTVVPFSSPNLQNQNQRPAPDDDKNT